MQHMVVNLWQLWASQGSPLHSFDYVNGDFFFMAKLSIA